MRRLVHFNFTIWLPLTAKGASFDAAEGNQNVRLVRRVFWRQATPVCPSGTSIRKENPFFWYVLLDLSSVLCISWYTDTWFCAIYCRARIGCLWECLLEFGSHKYLESRRVGEDQPLAQTMRGFVHLNFTIWLSRTVKGASFVEAECNQNVVERPLVGRITWIVCASRAIALTCRQLIYIY